MVHVQAMIVMKQLHKMSKVPRVLDFETYLT